ncbi:hypothetical protein HDU87_005967 [Geranomyces variabilis]|uniref:DUF676 domain-containing protein n=1 Tax=Geranomyces variabilis TaxID=109894 RepID=A0AAD5XV59_9FUNG|nr:hypothetical protein HDU87_005967 [Geranomyces variabilis]
MSLANLASQLRQKLNALLSVQPLSAVFPHNQNATAGDQLSRRRRREAKKAIMLWAGLNTAAADDTGRGDSGDSSAAERALRRAHIGLVVQQNHKAPRDPMVLCHGLFGFDVLGPQAVPGLQIHYWRGISEALREIGCKVQVSRVGSVAALKSRAHQLRDFLETRMEGQGINLVAHSMGGLDCRYVITHLPSSKFKVNSLTTVATPHCGSSFMDWCRDSFGVGLLQDYIRKQLDDVVSQHLAATIASSAPAGSSQSAADDIASESNSSSSAAAAASSSSSSAASAPRPQMTHEAAQTLIRTHPLIRALCSPLDSPAFANLTLDYCRTFNELTPDVAEVHYASYAAVAPKMSPLAPLYFSHRIVSEREGPNDGLVALESAKWGEFMGTLECDHWQLIPPRIRQIVRRDTFDPIGFYLNLATQLAEKGY